MKISTKKKISPWKKTGKIVSDKMEKGAVVEVWRKKPHPLYGKLEKKKKKFMAENILGAKEGDKVVIVPTRPLSKKKRWKIVEVLKDVAA
jgi:small subunit ribosomal protein S17